MLLPIRTTIVASVTALALALGSVAPAQAFGRGERGFVQGAAAAAVVGAIILDANRRGGAQGAVIEAPEPHYVRGHGVDGGYGQGHRRQRHHDRPTYRHYGPPVYRAPAYREPVYRAPVYVQPDYAAPVYRSPRAAATSVYRTPTAQAFNSYPYAERIAIQRRLARQGYYRSGLDGAFGPGTYRAIAAFAEDNGRTDALRSRSGAFALLDRLLA